MVNVATCLDKALYCARTARVQHLAAVFPTVQAAGRAWRTDCQEPGTGRDGAKYPVLVFEKEKPPSGAKTAGLAT